MPKITRNFTAGKMNKDSDEKLIPNGQYIDAMNVRINSTETGDKGVIENSIGNTQQTDIEYNGQKLSPSAVTIGALADSARETLYWFIHDSSFGLGATNKLDLIVSYNIVTNNLRYHVVSIDDGGGGNTTLNFNPQYLITGINLVDDLLFFTDDYNAPRYINIKRQYALPIANIDQFQNDEILVIKAPPTEPLTITPLLVNSDDNAYMSERFLCFAYRYRYKDNQYSATTQFTDPIFIPDAFNFTNSSFLNEGMKNTVDACIINYNTGGSEVVGIDLLFKEAANNIIRVIEKIDKAGILPDNSTETYAFSNQKIFTILPDSELLRLYDNVPRFAKAQTLMGNRLVYGNYIEGYNLLDDQGQPLRLEYEVDLVSQDTGETTLDTGIDNGQYLFGGLTLANDVIFAIDLTPEINNLNEGTAISIDITFEHSFFTGAVVPIDKTTETTLSFAYILQKKYNSVYELATSVEFQSAIGLVGQIETVPNSCNGIRFTDQFNCIIPPALNNFDKTDSGITVGSEPISILASPSSNIIGFQLLAMQWVDSITTDIAYEYYKINSVSASFQKTANTKSLHSNRSYEVGIVYTDDKLRSTTVLTSANNNIFVPCAFSVNQNKIQITIPPNQRPPSWASYYKFAAKTDREFYETIYSYLFVRDDTASQVYCLIDGENTRKVEVGDRLIVKADTSGALTRCKFTSVLEKEAKTSNFLGTSIPSPPGVYLKFNAADFNAAATENSIIDYGPRTAVDGQFTQNGFPLDYPILSYTCSIPDPAIPGQFLDYEIPAGSRIVFDYEFKRLGRGDGSGACERRIYTFQKTYISSANYASFEDWFRGDNIRNTLNDGISDVGDNSGDIQNEFIPTTSNTINDIVPELGKNKWRFFRDLTSNELVLQVTGTKRCSGSVYPSEKTRSTITGAITVFRASSLLVWETEPQDTQPDVYFEGSQLFEIDNLRQHLGNVQNQDYTLGLPAIIDTNFYNCYSFGNGVESYKIRDSISGKHFNLGNRVFSVSAQDYKEAKRFSDLTYSGVYNNETNVNKLNEFNLGLLNFKQLERSFGNIYILDGRETDIRVLQEDKISYVLAGKNLLSDAAAGSSITSIPEVLGTQIARIENYGISANPESYTTYGGEAYFTDAKRGAVLMLLGSSAKEQLVVVSEMGMSTWFRSMFVERFNTQKLGAYDPYMKEYVLVANNKAIPTEVECLSCGQTSTYPVVQGEDIIYCVNLQNLVGEVTVTYNILSATGDIEVVATYDGNDFTSGEVNTSGFFVFDKDKISENNATIRLKSVLGSAVLQVVVSCPVPETLTVIEICLTNNADGGKFIHNEYRYTDTPFVSQLQSQLVTFVTGTTNPLVSQYDVFSGAQGLSAIPTNGSIVSLISNRIGFDNFIFDPLQHRFNYLRTNTLYANNPTDITSLLAAANSATPITGGGNTYQAQFTMPSSGDYLYLIWDYRTAYQIDMCYDATNSRGLCCCGCQPE